MTEWIDIKKEKPDDLKRVIFYSEIHRVTTGYLDGRHAFVHYPFKLLPFNQSGITHWMHLPNKPEMNNE